MTDISRTLSLIEAIMDNTNTPFFDAHQKATTPMGTNISETKQMLSSATNSRHRQRKY